MPISKDQLQFGLFFMLMATIAMVFWGPLWLILAGAVTGFMTLYVRVEFPADANTRIPETKQPVEPAVDATSDSKPVTSAGYPGGLAHQ